MKRRDSPRKNRLYKTKYLQRKRAFRTFRRRVRHYNPDRYSDDFRQRINPSVKIRGRFAGTIKIPAPKRLDMNSDLELTVNYINKLKEEVFRGSHKVIKIDHDNLRSISIDAALILVAELQRCIAYSKGKKRIVGTYPESEKAGRLLSGIGFYEALSIASPDYGASRKRFYSKVVFHNRIIPERVKYLLDCFETTVKFHPHVRKSLHVALMECMDNCYQHAYKDLSRSPFLTKQWWLAGFSDLSRGQVAFSFFDQGASIPVTIRTRPLQLTIGSDVLSSDSAIIREATSRRLSRFGGNRRGYGLPFLKKFIQILDGEVYDGMLHIVSNKGDYQYRVGGNENQGTCNSVLGGTLLTWTIRRSDYDKSSDKPIDLS